MFFTFLVLCCDWFWDITEAIAKIWCIHRLGYACNKYVLRISVTDFSAFTSAVGSAISSIIWSVVLTVHLAVVIVSANLCSRISKDSLHLTGLSLVSCVLSDTDHILIKYIVLNRTSYTNSYVIPTYAVHTPMSLYGVFASQLLQSSLCGSELLSDKQIAESTESKLWAESMMSVKCLVLCALYAYVKRKKNSMTPWTLSVFATKNTKGQTKDVLWSHYNQNALPLRKGLAFNNIYAKNETYILKWLCEKGNLLIILQKNRQGLSDCTGFCIDSQ